METKEIFLKCECSGCALSVEADMELPGDYNIGLWHHGIDFTRKFSWRKRLKLAWQLVRKGTLYKDCVVLSSESVVKLCWFIDETEAEYRKIADQKVFDRIMADNELKK